MNHKKMLSSATTTFFAVRKALFITLCLCCLAFGQHDKGRIAVYLTGSGDPNTDKALSIMFLDAIVKAYPRWFDAIDRQEEFLAQIDREHIKQRGGAINDAQIIALGKQAGVDFICIGDITQAFGTYIMNARINHVETARVVASGRSNSKTLDDIDVIENLLNNIIRSMGQDLLRNFR